MSSFFDGSDGPPSPAAYWRMTKKKFFMAVGTSFVLINLLFLGNMSYIYGALFKDPRRVHGLNILMVDYDGGAVGQSLRMASSKLAADTFPSIYEKPTSEYDAPSDVQRAICHGDYWAAVYVKPHASANLAQALQGGSAAASYNPTDALEIVWNQIRYPIAEDSYIKSSLLTLTSAATSIYHTVNGSAALALTNQSDAAARTALFNPISYSSNNLGPASQGTRVLYNTASIVMFILMQFFFVLASNGIAGEFGYFAKISVRTLLPVRLAISVAYTLVAALVNCGYIWAFKEDWPVTGAMFAEMWMIIWLTMHAHWLVIDAAAALIPMPFVPFFLFTWVITNLATTIMPFDIMAGFYRIGYALPSHSLFETFITIWSNGCYNRLYRTLPIICAWWIFGFAADLFAQLRKARLAKQAVIKGQRPPSMPSGPEKDLDPPSSSDSA